MTEVLSEFDAADILLWGAAGVATVLLWITGIAVGFWNFVRYGNLRLLAVLVLSSCFLLGGGAAFLTLLALYP